MISVLWATQVYPRHPGDLFGSFLHRLARELPSRGISVRVVAPSAEGLPLEESRDGVHIRRFRYASPGQETLAYTGEMHRAALRHPLRFANFLRCFGAALRDEVRTHRPEILHAHWWIPPGLVARGVARREAIPLVLSLHGTDVRLLHGKPFVRGLARRVFRGAASVLPVSAALARDVERLGLGGPRPEVLPMPADPEVFHPEDSAGSGSPGEAPGGSPGGSPPAACFVVAARLTEQKRVDRALRALAAIAEPAVRLEIAGDGPERAALEALAGKLGLEDRVRFHGRMEPAELARLFRSARAVLLTSEREGYGLTLVEGALCGLPAVGVRSGGIEELIEPEVTGLLVPPEDGRALTQALERLAANPAEAARLGGAAREKLSTTATPGPLADRLAARYRVLVGRSPADASLDAPPRAP